MLYFSQARDVRRLREWAGREPERAAEVELRAAQIASQAIAQAYESMALRQSEADAAAEIAREQGLEVEDLVVAVEPPAPVETAEHPEPVVSGMEGAFDDPAQAAEAAAGAEAAEGEPHQESVVTGMESASDDREHVQELAAAAVGNGQPTGESEAAVSGSIGPMTPVPDMPVEDAEEAAQLTESVAAETAAVEASAESTDRAASVAPPAAAAGATGEIRPSRLAPSTPAATRGQIPLPPLPPLDTSEFLAVNRPVPTLPTDYQSLAESAGTGGFESGGRPPERRSGRMPVIIAGVLVAIFAITLAATQLGGGDGETGKSDASATRQARDKKKEVSTAERDPQVNRPAVTVSVLNGTQTAGLASLVKEQLVSAGFTSTTSGNRNDNVNHATSTVFYAPGNKLEAKEVAKELTIDDVKEIDEDTQTAGGSAPVVVVLGADIEQ